MEVANFGAAIDTLIDQDGSRLTAALSYSHAVEQNLVAQIKPHLSPFLTYRVFESESCENTTITTMRFYSSSSLSLLLSINSFAVLECSELAHSIVVYLLIYKRLCQHREFLAAQFHVQQDQTLCQRNSCETIGSSLFIETATETQDTLLQKKKNSL